MVETSHTSPIPILPFSNPKSKKLWKPDFFFLKLLWQQNLVWTDMRLFLVFIIPLSVNIYTFYHRHINGFVYRVPSQTLLGTVSDAQNRHHTAFLKSKKIWVPQNLWPPRFWVRLYRPEPPATVPWRSRSFSSCHLSCLMILSLLTPFP